MSCVACGADWHTTHECRISTAMAEAGQRFTGHDVPARDVEAYLTGIGFDPIEAAEAALARNSANDAERNEPPGRGRLYFPYPDFDCPF